MSDHERQLTRLLLELLAVDSVTGHEAAMADDVAGRLGALGMPVTRVGHSVVGGEPSGGGERPVVALVNHLDVVPPTDADREPRRDGDRVVGRGASDMKSGLAVSLDLAADAEVRDGPWDVVVVGYAGEEGPADGNELADVLGEVGWLADVDLAVVLEPTDLEVQLGCLGGIHAVVTVHGQAAHSARPWHGRNALTTAAPLLAGLDALEPTAVELDGVTYHDVWTATQAWTGNARNVVPAAFSVNVNLRFAPDRSLDDAEDGLRERVDGWLPGEDITIEVIDRAPPAPPRADHPAVRALVDAVGAPVAAKQAWTDVARFAELGVPALNYGPGLTSQAHQGGEWVPVANLATARAALARLLTRAPGGIG